MLNEETRRFLAMMDSGPRLWDLGVQDSRAAFEDLSKRVGPRGPLSVSTRDMDIIGPAGDLHIRIYTPTTSTPAGTDDRRPVIFYLHGGAFEIGSVEAYDGWCRYIANASGYLAVAIDYRLIPEHPFPAAVDDTRAGLQWIRENIQEYGGDPSTVVIAGDSAGGSLAASLSIRAVANERDRLAGQLLIYPCTDWSDEWPSMNEVPHGNLFLTRRSFRWTRSRYLTDEDSRFDPSAAPLQAMDHSGHPPALIITAEYDPFRDQGEAYGMKLIKAGVPVMMHRYLGTIHGFVIAPEIIPAGYEALDECVSWLVRLAIEKSTRKSAGEQLD